MLIDLKWQLLFDMCPPAAVKRQIWEEPEWSDRSVCRLSPEFTGCFPCRCLFDILLHKIFVVTLPLGVIVMCLSWHQIWLFGKMVVKCASLHHFPSNTSCKCHFVQSTTSTVWFLDLKSFFLQCFLTTWWKIKYNNTPRWMYVKDGVTNYSKYMQRSGYSMLTSVHFSCASKGN